MMSGYNFNLLCNCWYTRDSCLVYLCVNRARVSILFLSRTKASARSTSHTTILFLFYIYVIIYIYSFSLFVFIFLSFYLFISNHFTNSSYSLMVIYLIYSIRSPKQQSSIRIWERTCILYFLKIFQLFLFLSPPRFEQNGKNNFVSRENGWNGALEIGEK